MTKAFRSQTFMDVDDRESGAIFSDLAFYRCRFERCAVSITLDPGKRSTFCRMKIVQCEEVNCGIWPAIIEDVMIDGLETGQLLIANACAYRHVVLRGKVGSIKLRRAVPYTSSVPAWGVPRVQERMDRANAEYYAKVDWALDISEAEFTSGEVEGIPLDLVRRDPETQVIVRSKAIQEGLWRQVDLSGTYRSVLLDAYARRNVSDGILVVPKAARNFKDLQRGLMALRRAGIAEPD